MLAPEFLISPILSLDALLISGDNKSFNFYLHGDHGIIRVGDGSIPQEITTLKPSTRYISHIRDQLSAISSVVNITFLEVSNPENADICLFFDSQIDLGASSSITYGVAVPNITYSPRRQWIEIFLNYHYLQDSTFDFQAYVFNHELLHSLGLEHTFDDSDGDFYLSTDPQLSATPEQTVMSYRAPESGVYPTDLTSSDYNALIHIYGPVDTTNVDYSIVHRLLNVDTGQHLFTANSVEIDILTGQPQPPFIDEGIAYQVSSGANQDLYRFYNPLNGLHFYTASTYEKDFLISSDSTSLLFEGSAYKVFSNNVIRTDLTPVYRFYDSTNNTHLYTANSLEKEIWQSDSYDWLNEGIAWYA